VGSFSRHFQQYITPSVVVRAPHRLQLRLMVLTPLVANRPRIPPDTAAS